MINIINNTKQDSRDKFKKNHLWFCLIDITWFVDQHLFRLNEGFLGVRKNRRLLSVKTDA
jgi:hypothetical protein